MLRRILFWFIRLLPASLRIKLYFSLRKLSIRIYGRTDFFAQRLPFGLYFKQGQKAAQEVLAIRLVSTHNSLSSPSDGTIPVPQILDLVGNVFIMTRLEGEVLGNLFSKMNEDEVAQVRRELGRVVQILRGIPRVDGAGMGGKIGVVSGPMMDLPCCDVNRVDNLEFGPFTSVAAFHSYLLQLLPPNVSLRERFSITHGLSPSTTDGRNLNAHSPDSSKVDDHTVFTHGDLNLRNILITRHQRPTLNGKPGSTIVISGIIDWTCAGWYPMYWEHTKAIYPQSRFKMWTDLWMGIAEDTVPEEKEKYRKKVELEKEIWRYIN